MFKIKKQYRRKNISKCSEGNPLRNIRFRQWILRLCVMICCGYLVVSESCPLLSLCYLPTRHTQRDKCFVWPSKFVFLPLNCDFISLGRARQCVCVRLCVSLCKSGCVCVWVYPLKKKKKGRLHIQTNKIYHFLIAHFFHSKKTTEQAKELKQPLTAALKHPLTIRLVCFYFSLLRVKVATGQSRVNIGHGLAGLPCQINICK